jgi:hypothetical protein
MKKSDSEQAIRQLCDEWRKECEAARTWSEQADHPSFSQFTAWLDRKHYSHYLNFRSAEGSRQAAEQWFDEEFKQSWRN